MQDTFLFFKPLKGMLRNSLICISGNIKNPTVEIKVPINNIQYVSANPHISPIDSDTRL